MTKLHFKDYFNSLGESLNRLKIYLNDNVTKKSILVDATIHRFEFIFELFWKNLKKILKLENVEATTPRDTLSKSYQFELINDEEYWVSMLEDRNGTSHQYNKDEAYKVFERIKTYFSILENTYNTLKAKYEL